MRKVYALLVIISVLVGFVLPLGESATENAPYWIGIYGGTLLISPSPVLSFPDGSAVFVSYVKKGMIVKYSVLRKVAPNGSVEWTVKYGDGVIINALAMTPEGRIVAAGAYFSNNSPYPYGFLMEVDKNGKVIWAKRYGGNKTDSLSVVTVLKNGDILAAGMTMSFKDARGDVWLLKVDGHGNVLWERTYGTEWKDEPLSMLVMPNGNIVVAGISLSGNVPRGLILTLNSSGNLIWAREYQSGKGLIIRGISYSDGKFYTSGYVYLGNNTIGAILMRLDLNGNVLQSEAYYREGFFVLGGNMVPVSRGVWLSGALVRVLPNETTYYGILLHASNSSLVNVRVYGPGIAFRTLTIAPNGSILLSGVTKNNTPLMARLPKNGTLPGCRYLTNLTVEETSLKVNVSTVTLNVGNPNFKATSLVVTAGESGGNVSLLCTYTQEEKSEICGPGFIVLLALLAVLPLRRH